jgi:hypothetical protein
MTDKQLRRLFIKFRNRNANLGRVEARYQFKEYLAKLGRE